MNLKSIFNSFRHKVETAQREGSDDEQMEKLFDEHLEQMETELKGFITTEVTRQMGTANVAAAGAGPIPGQKVFSPETDAPGAQQVDLNANPIPVPTAAPAQPETVVEDPQAQAASAQAGDPAFIEPAPGALPGSTGTVGETAPDGSTKVTNDLAPDGGATQPISTISPDQTPAPTVPTGAATKSEAAQPTGGQSAFDAANPTPAPGAPGAVVETPATEPVDEADEDQDDLPDIDDTAAPVATVIHVDPDTGGPAIVTAHPETGDVLTMPILGDPNITPAAGTVLVNSETGVPTVDHTLVEGAAPVELGETTAAHPDVVPPETVVAGDPTANVAASAPAI